MYVGGEAIVGAMKVMKIKPKLNCILGNFDRAGENYVNISERIRKDDRL